MGHCQSSTGCLESLDQDSEVIVIVLVLLFSGLILPFLGIYLDVVVPSAVGVRRSPCFCFTDLFNCIFRRNAKRQEGMEDEEAVVEELDDADMDPDVREERDRVRSGAVTPA